MYLHLIFASSFRTAIDLKEVLIQAERAKEEVQRMQKRVEVLEAVVNDSLESAKDGMEVRWMNRSREWHF